MRSPRRRSWSSTSSGAVLAEEDLLTFVSLKALLKDNPDNMDMLFQYEKGRGKVFISTKKQLLAELANEEEGKEEEEEEEEVS